MAAATSQHEVVCADGWRLAVTLVEPEGPARAVAVVGHAMMVDRRTMDRGGGGLVSTLAARGIAVVWPDLRGHGQSGPLAGEGGRWSYDDLVERDAPALYAFARARFPSLPLVAVGHSLFGHVSLAHLSRHPEAEVDALVLVAANLWLRAGEPSALVWQEKRLLLALMAFVSRRFGRFPARRLRIGNTDESADYVAQFADWVRQGDWSARDGFSYWEALAWIDRPVLALAGTGDRLMAHPASMRAFVARVPRVRFRCAGRERSQRRDVTAAERLALDFDPGHMGLVTDARSRPVWEEIARFIRDEVPRRSRP